MSIVIEKGKKKKRLRHIANSICSPEYKEPLALTIIKTNGESTSIIWSFHQWYTNSPCYLGKRSLDGKNRNDEMKVVNRARPLKKQKESELADR